MHVPVFLKKVKVLVVQSYLTLCDPTDCSPSGSSVPGILQARILEWVAMPFSKGSSRPRDQTWVSCIALPTKVHLVKAMVFPVVMYGCESWTIRKAERRRTDAFELWCWRRLLRVPWTATQSNQSILKAINPEYLLEGLVLNLQYFGHLL